MPRRNSNARDKKTEFHGATHFHKGYLEKCVGCFFVGNDFSCTTSDGECLITHEKSESGENKAEPEDNKDGNRLCNP